MLKNIIYYYTVWHICREGGSTRSNVMALSSGLFFAQLVGFRNKPHPGRGGPVLHVSGRSDDPRILVSSSLCKDGGSWGQETGRTGAGHESRTFLQKDEVARHQCWFLLGCFFSFCLDCFWKVGWDGIASANKWHGVPVPDCKNFDVHRFCMSLWSCHAPFLCLPVGLLL